MKLRSLLSLRRYFRRALTVPVLFAAGRVAAGDAADKPAPTREVDVIAVTDMTEKGSKYPLPARDKPVYYMMIDLGRKVIVSDMTHSGDWGGETLPDRTAARDAVIAALAAQGYRPGDLEKHVPSQLLFFSWGMVQGGDTVSRNSDGSIGNPTRPALGFLGGDKLGLMWDRERISSVDSRMFTRGFERMGLQGKVLQFSESNLFLGRVEAYTMDSLKAKKKTLLWETRFAALADGLTLAESLPLMIKVAAPYFGKATPKPVNVNATKTYGARVDLEETKFKGTVPETEPKPNEKK